MLLKVLDYVYFRLEYFFSNSLKKAYYFALGKRRLWTSTCYGRPQVVALSGFTAPPPLRIGNDMGIVQCIRHIIRHEGPMALFKGNDTNLYKSLILVIPIFLS